MTVLVLGGSSQIGHFLLPRLQQLQLPVLALSRSARMAQPGVTWLAGHLPEAMPTSLPPLQAIICFGPLLPFARWLAQAPLVDQPRIIATSSMSAQTKADSVVPSERAISQQLRDGERTLAESCAARGLRWTVLRPTLVYGAGLDKSLTPIAQRAMRTRVFPLPAGRGLRQPVHADDIAQACIAALQSDTALDRILPIGGGERLLAAQMFARVRRSLPVSTLPIPLGQVPLRLAARLLPQVRGMLLRLNEDLIADNTELVARLGVHPRPFKPQPEFWSPAQSD